MRARRLSAALAGVTLLAAGGVVAAPGSWAHPPDNPYDNTYFAPIADESGMPFGLQQVTSGLVAPTKAIAAPGEPGTLYVVDQPGQVWAVDLATKARRLFHDVSGRLVPLGVLPGTPSFDERGLLGLAFHPQYQRNGLFYTYTSESAVTDDGTRRTATFATTLPPGYLPDHQNVVTEWRVNPSGSAVSVDPASARELMRIDWPQFNHDGGDLAFGPDGMLYIATGDGGGQDDADDTDTTDGTRNVVVGHQRDGNAQKLNNPLGKILRVDVNGRSHGEYTVPADNPFVGRPGAVSEVWAYGLRNPFRFSFDRLTGQMFVGDVGQNEIEEINRVTKGGNYGWSIKEGTLFFHANEGRPGTATREGSLPPGVTVIDPLAQYDLHHEGHSVIGGYVYRGTQIPELRGKYVFGEWSRIFRFPAGPNNWGRLLYLDPSSTSPATPGPKEIREFRGFAEVADRLGLVDPAQPPAYWKPTLSVLGIGEDAAGELYVMGNVNGVPFGDDGVVLRLSRAQVGG